MVRIARSSGNILAEIDADDQRLVVGGTRERKLIDQPVAEVDHIAVAAPIHQHIIFVTRIPSVEPFDQAIERRTRGQLAALRAENANRRLGAGQDVEDFITEQRRKQAIAGAEHDEVVAGRAPMSVRNVR